MSDLEFIPCKANPDVRLKPTVKPCGINCYDNVLIYVHDIMVVSYQAESIMECLSGLYCLKEDPSTGKKYAAPDRYLGANVGLYTIPSDTPGKRYWFMSSDDYVSEAIKNVEQKLGEVDLHLKSSITTPSNVTSYRPELDVTPTLSDEKANYYQNLIGVL